MNKRKDFSPEFKREAARLLDSGQKPATDRSDSAA
jgi:transposase-like protein